MSDDFFDGNDSPRLYVKLWLKVLMYSVCLLPIVLITLAFLRQILSPNGSLVIVLCIPTIIAFVWLFIRLYSLCSITVDANGVGQTFALIPSVNEKHVYLRWEQIRQVSFSSLSYHFIGENEEKLELNTSLFGDAAATIQTVRSFLPETLRADLDRRLG